MTSYGAGTYDPLTSPVHNTKRFAVVTPKPLTIRELVSVCQSPTLKLVMSPVNRRETINASSEFTFALPLTSATFRLSPDKGFEDT